MACHGHGLRQKRKGRRACQDAGPAGQSRSALRSAPNIRSPQPTAGADIVGKSIREAAFRGRFHAAVVAIKRDGMPLNWSDTHIGDEVLKVGSSWNNSGVWLGCKEGSSVQAAEVEVGMWEFWAQIRQVACLSSTAGRGGGCSRPSTSPANHSCCGFRLTSQHVLNPPAGGRPAAAGCGPPVLDCAGRVRQLPRCGEGRPGGQGVQTFMGWALPYRFAADVQREARLQLPFVLL